MSGQDKTNTGRKLTGYPIGGFGEKVTKRWQFGQPIQAKIPAQRPKPPEPVTPERPLLRPVPQAQPQQSHQSQTSQQLPYSQSIPPAPQLSQSYTQSIPPAPQLSQSHTQSIPPAPQLSQSHTQSIPPAPQLSQSHTQSIPPPPLSRGPSRSLEQVVTEPQAQTSFQEAEYQREEEPMYIIDEDDVKGPGKTPAGQQYSQGLLTQRVPSIIGGILVSGDSSIDSLKRPSVILPSLMEDEKYFHDLVKSGDVQEVQSFLNQRPGFNVNCTNFQGTTALHLAVKSGNEQMVNTLLEHAMIESGDCALHAIKDNNIEILKLILEKQRMLSPNLEYLASQNSTEFADNITPLILAAICGHYEIVGLLLDRGHIIPRPHKPRCFCKTECLPILQTQDPLTVSSGKLQIYTALCNPAYICHTTEDPILASFKLSKELKVAGNVDSLFRKEYYELSEKTRIFAAELIGECRSAEEVEIILSEVPMSKISSSFTFPRLILALDYKQKEFVASPNVQQLLEVTWIGDWYSWKGYRKVVKVLYVLPRLIMLPFILIVLIAMPTSNLAKFYALPINKLLSSIASYSLFLLLIYVQCNVDKSHQTKESQPTGVEIFLVIFVFSFIWNSIRTIIIQGPGRFYKFGWNIYQSVTEILFLITFIFWLVATVQATQSGNLKVERKFWGSWDAELVAEGFFVGATIMAFLKVLMVLQINYQLGPLQVSIGKMTTDFAKYTIIMSIFLVAFSVALCRFYSYYAGMVQKDPETGTESKQEDSFISFTESFKTLFWGIFGLAGYEVADVVIENLPDANGQPTVINEHDFTESVGYVAFAAYTILMVVVILNMLIATMSNTFQKIVDNVDTEWVFGKTEVYLQYINYPVLPPPLNLIPTTYGVKTFFSNKNSDKPKQDIEKGLTSEVRSVEEFHVLMSQLVQRYFSSKSNGN